LGTFVAELNLTRHLRVVSERVTFLRTVVKPAVEFGATQGRAASIWAELVKV
jgi:hypothetical protein